MREKSGPELLLWHSHLFLGLAGAMAAVWPLPALLGASLVVIYNRRFWNPAYILAGLIIFCAAFLFTDYIKSARTSEYEKFPDWVQKTTRICGTITNVQQFPENKLQILLADVRPENDPLARPLPGYTRWMLQSPPDNFNPMYGQNACLQRHIFKQRGFINSPDGSHNLIFAKQQTWRIFSKGSDGDPVLIGKGSFPEEIRQKLKKEFLDLAGFSSASYQEVLDSPSQGRAILVALLFGDRSFLSRQTVNDFTAGGLAHSLALSGQHLGIAALAAICVIYLAGFAKPALFLFSPRIILVALCSIPLGLLYLWLGNAPASLLRAFCMLFFLAIWVCRGKAWSGPDLVCAAIFALCCFKPAVIFETGLHFSVLCVLVIALMGPFIPDLPKNLQKKLPPTFQNFARRLWQIFFISLAIQLFLLPLVLTHFTQASFWFPLNILWLPLLGLFVLPCAFFALVLSPLFPSIASFLINVAAEPCDWLLAILEFLRKKNFLEMPALMIPHWCNLFAYAMLLCACACSMAKVKTRTTVSFTCCALLFLAAGPTLRLIDMLNDSPELSMLDVGQGQAILIKFDGYGHILVDGGGGNGNFDIGRQVVGATLAKNFPPFLDASINSHPDIDHLGGLLSLSPYFNNRLLFHNGHELKNKNADKWRKLTESENARILFAGDIIHLGKPEKGLKLVVLHPPASEFPDNFGQKAVHPGYDGNNASIVLRLSKNDEGLAILTGDAEKKIFNTLANSGHNLQTKILVASHHGSNTGLAPDFYRKVNPQFVLASCGFQNRWNFPGNKLQDFLASHNLPLLTTSKLGRIDVMFGHEENPHITSVLPNLTEQDLQEN